MRAVVIVVILVLVGCTQKGFAFRELRTGQWCSQASASEERQGSRLLRSTVPDSREPFYKITELRGSFQGQDALVQIGCISPMLGPAKLYDANYQMRASTQSEADAQFRAVVTSLSKRYPISEIRPVTWRGKDGTWTRVGTLADFGCDNSEDSGEGYYLHVTESSPTTLEPYFQVLISMRFGGGVC